MTESKFQQAKDLREKIIKIKDQVTYWEKEVIQIKNSETRYIQIDGRQQRNLLSVKISEMVLADWKEQLRNAEHSFSLI